MVRQKANQKSRGKSQKAKVPRLGQYPVALSMVFAAFCASQPVVYHFDTDPAERAPAGWTSYATGSGRAGNWLVKQMSEAPSGKQVLEQTDADATDSRFPVIVANDGEYGDLDLSVKGKAISGKVDQGIGLVFRFRDPKSYYVVR